MPSRESIVRTRSRSLAEFAASMRLSRSFTPHFNRSSACPTARRSRSTHKTCRACSDDGITPEARDIARRINETPADIVYRHPSRFGALATLPGRDIGGAVAEIVYALDTSKMDGVRIRSMVRGAEPPRTNDERDVLALVETSSRLRAWRCLKQQDCGCCNERLVHGWTSPTV